MATAATRQPRLAHIPALDGLRGLAVVAVLLFHGGLAWATGGFLGVDVFFVLSGFLITSLLLGEQRATGTIGLGGFWSRRARRLLPALLLLIAAVAAATTLFDPSAQVSLRDDALAALGYVANWRFVIEGSDYFGRTAADSPLNHLWSLAIEEQFYLVWPLVVLAVARGRRAATWVAIVAGAGAAASTVAMVLLHESGDDVSRVYYGTDTRAHTVLIGALVAAILAPRPMGEATSGWLPPSNLLATPTAATWPQPVRVLLGVVAALAAVNLVGAVALVDGDQSWLYEGGLPLFSLATAAVLAHSALIPEGIVATVLAVPPLRFVGRLSYGLYLWHWPIYLLLTSNRTGLSGPALLGARLVATLAVAYASYELIERPIRQGLLPGWRAGAAVPVAAAATAGIVLLATLGVPGAGPPDEETALASAAPATLRPAPQLRPTTPGATVPARSRAPGEPVRVLVLGDSVALTLAQPLERTAPRAGIALTHAATLGCGVARGGPLRYVGEEQEEPPACPTWPAQWSQALEAQDPDVALVVVGRWEVVDRFWEGRWTNLGDPAFDRYIETELDQAMITARRRGAKVAFATVPYYSRGERRDGGSWPEDDPARVNRLNELIRRAAARHASYVSVVDLGAKTAKDGAYTRSLDGVQLRYDGVHFTPVGARWLAPWLFPQLEALGPPVVAGKPTSTVTSTTTTARAQGREKRATGR